MACASLALFLLSHVRYRIKVQDLVVCCFHNKQPRESACVHGYTNPHRLWRLFIVKMNIKKCSHCMHQH